MSYLTDGPGDAEITIVLAHGAGGPMQSPFMATVARGLAANGFRVVRFNFPYMEARRKVPDREPVLLSRWREVIRDHQPVDRLVIGGKSLGGRMASLIADEMGVRALICLGYPFHPPGNPAKLRTAHLGSLRTPTLIIQGTRDPFGSPDDVAGYQLSPSIEIFWMEGGDHSLRPSGRSAEREKTNITAAIMQMTEFIRART